MFWFIGCQECGILAPQPGIEPVVPPALEGEVLTTGPPGKSPEVSLLDDGVVEVLVTRSYMNCLCVLSNLYNKT